MNFKIYFLQAVAVHTCNPSTQLGLCEFKANLVYKASFRAAKATREKPCLETKQTKKTYFMCMTFCLMYVCETCVCLVPAEARRGHHIPLTGVTEGYKLPCPCWKQNFQALWKINQCSQPLRHLSSPNKNYLKILSQKENKNYQAEKKTNDWKMQMAEHEYQPCNTYNTS